MFLCFEGECFGFGFFGRLGILAFLCCRLLFEFKPPSGFTIEPVKS